MPADFTAYFGSAGQRLGQSLLQFVTEHDEKLRRLEKHKVVLPPEVQGWYLLSRANLSREQKQMVMTQANTLKRNKIQEAMFAMELPAPDGPCDLLEKVVATALTMRLWSPSLMTVGRLG